MRIRKATPNDAAAVLTLLENLYAETTFLWYEPGEMTITIETYAKRMAEGIEKQNWVMFVAERDHDFVGVIFGSRGSAKRTSHSFMLGLGVLQAYWQQGIGGALLGAVDMWAKEQKVHRIELTVRTTNSRAIELYERVGFEREGLKRHLQQVSGEYVDEYLMSKLVPA